jgi:phospholipid transport system substrate-binding protein
VVAVAVACLAAPGTVRAGEPTDGLRDFFGAIDAVVADPRTEDQPLEKLKAIRPHVDAVFDYRAAAALALGREWTARTASEQSEFVALFADVLERSFVWRLAGRASLSGGVKVHYLGETVAGDSATVDTAVASRDGNDLRLEYRMVRRAARWMVRDVVVDGVSTMENYHAQFQRVVRDRSWSDLVAQLRAKVGTLADTPAAALSPGARPAAIAAAPAVAPAPSIPERTATDEPAPTRVDASSREPAIATLPRAAAAPPEPPRVRVPEPVRSYWVQVGAFRKVELARRIAGRVGGAVSATPRGRYPEPLHRVRVGPFSDRAQAAARMRQLQALGYQPFLAVD